VTDEVRSLDWRDKTTCEMWT